MFNLDAITNKNDKNYDKNRHNKNNALLDLIQKQNNSNPIDKIYLYDIDLGEPKYQFLIEKRENAGINNYNDPTALIKYSNTMDHAYSNIDDYSPKRKRKILIVFDDRIADILTNKKFLLKAIIKELFIRCRKLNISLVFISLILVFQKKPD